MKHTLLTESMSSGCSAVVTNGRRRKSTEQAFGVERMGTLEHNRLLSLVQCYSPLLRMTS